MTQGNTTAAVIIDKGINRPVARIVLNGYNIAAGGPLGRAGAMRSFKLLEGNLYSYWNAHALLHIRAEDGRVSDVRIAALPADEASAGLIEFVA